MENLSRGVDVVEVLQTTRNSPNYISVPPGELDVEIPEQHHTIVETAISQYLPEALKQGHNVSFRIQRRQVDTDKQQVANRPLYPHPASPRPYTPTMKLT